VLREVDCYLDAELHVRKETDPLIWWREHRFQFPRIAVAARKWLCVPGTSTPSERVFSHCGVALSAKRASMRGDALMNQVLLKNNLKHVSLGMEDIKKALS
jgi:zinc finger BED domain-containing protein 1 (E3 SUMO-protein ligase ZBED1)